MRAIGQHRPTDLRCARGISDTALLVHHLCAPSPEILTQWVQPKFAWMKAHTARRRRHCIMFRAMQQQLLERERLSSEPVCWDAYESSNPALRFFSGFHLLFLAPRACTDTLDVQHVRFVRASRSRTTWFLFLRDSVACTAVTEHCEGATFQDGADSTKQPHAGRGGAFRS